MGKQIRISDELYDFLTNQFIRKGETYDEILKRLLKKCWDVEFEEKASTQSTE